MVQWRVGDHRDAARLCHLARRHSLDALCREPPGADRRRRWRVGRLCRGAGVRVYDGEQFKMWYEGHDGRPGASAMRCPDGVHWERAYEDPIVSLGPEDAWNSQVSSEPYVLFDGQTYRLWHSGYDGDRYRVGLVTAPAVYVERGEFVSPPIEAAQPVEWGELSCDLSLPAGAAVELAVAASADGAAWDEWAPAASALVSGVNHIDLTALGLSPSRFLRYRVALTTSDPAVSPLIRAISVAKAVPDMALSAATGELAVQSGQSESIAVSIDSVRGFSSTVALMVDGLPQGVKAAWNPGEVVPPARATLVLAVEPAAAPGAYDLAIVARSGSLEHRQPLALVVVAPTPTPSPTATASATTMPTAMPTATPIATPVASPTLVPTPTPTSTSTPLPVPPPVLPPAPAVLWLGSAMAGGGALALAVWLAARASGRGRRIWSREPRWRSPLWGVVLALIAVVGIVIAWCYIGARQRAGQEPGEGILPGAQATGVGARALPTLSATPVREGSLIVAGIDANGLTVDQLRGEVEAMAIAPLRRAIQVRYFDRTTEQQDQPTKYTYKKKKKKTAL